MDVVRYFAYNRHIDPHALSLDGICFETTDAAVLPQYRLIFNVLEDELFRFEKRGLANIVPHFGSVVEGIVYLLQERELRQLDSVSGVGSLKYYRKKVTVQSRKGLRFEALTYVAWPDVTAEGLLPADRYLKQLITAASQQGISPKFRQWLENHPTIC